jgi:membrane-associated phospholipid phosphatase
MMKKFDWLKIIAQFFSFLFHPVFIPFYTVLLYFYISPRIFLQQNIKFLLLYLSIVSVIIPILFFGVMFYAKAFTSIDVKTARERFFLSTIMAVVYGIILKKIIHFHQYIELFPFFTGILLTVSGLAVYNYFKQKPSIHAAAMGGSITFFLIWSYYSRINILPILSLLILIAAMIIASRIYLKTHTPGEIIRGLSLGILMQITAFYISLLLF